MPRTTTHPRVLIVDPDDDTRQLLSTALQPLHCDVVEASDGRDALAKALSQVPALVLTETTLPFLDGYALCRMLRIDSMTRAVPILVITGDARPAQLDRAREAGADAVLVKPTPPDDVVATVARLLRIGQRPTKQVSSGPKTTVKAHSPFETTAPPLPPRELRCPSCDRHLTFMLSHVGGVSASQPEQWDTFTCVPCRVSFEYRHRTRRLRRIPAKE